MFILSYIQFGTVEMREAPKFISLILQKFRVFSNKHLINKVKYL